MTAQSCPTAEAPLAFQQARGDRCRHQLALLCVWKGLSIVGRWSVGHCSASRTVPAAGTCWFPASASPFSCPPSEAGLGVSSSFSRTDGAEQVSKPAHLHLCPPRGWHRQAVPRSLTLSFTRYSALLQKPLKREAKPVCNPQTRQALNLIIIELVGRGPGPCWGVPWAQ